MYCFRFANGRNANKRETLQEPERVHWGRDKALRQLPLLQL